MYTEFFSALSNEPSLIKIGSVVAEILGGGADRRTDVRTHGKSHTLTLHVSRETTNSLRSLRSLAKLASLRSLHSLRE